MSSPENVTEKPLQFDLRGLLTRLTIQTKLRKWRTLDEAEIIPIFEASLCLRNPKHYLNHYHTNRLVISRRRDFSNYHAPAYENWEKWKELALNQLENTFFGAKELLLHFQGRIISAGGAIFKALNSMPNNAGDLDLFFVDPEVEADNVSDAEKFAKAEALLFEALAFLTERWLNDSDFQPVGDQAEDDRKGMRHALVTRNQFVTTLHLINHREETTKIQFIHRVYPTVASVLGGFDLTTCMGAWDGQRFLFLEIGAWSILGAVVIVDTSRRSTSFEHRLQKYAMKCDVIFPGLSEEVFPKQCQNWLVPQDALKLAEHLIVQNGFCLEWFYESNGGSSKKLVKVDSDQEATEKKVLLRELEKHAVEKGYVLDKAVLRAISYDDQVEQDKLVKILEATLFERGNTFQLNRFLNPGHSAAMGVNGIAPRNQVLKLSRLDIRIPRPGEMNYYDFNVRPARAPGTVYALADSDYEHDTGSHLVVEQKAEGFRVHDYEHSSTEPLFAVLNNCSNLVRGNAAGIVSCFVLLHKDLKLKDLMFKDYFHQQMAAKGLKTCVIPLEKFSKERLHNAIVQGMKTVNLGNWKIIYDNYAKVIFHRADDPELTNHEQTAKNFLFPHFRGETVDGEEWIVLEERMETTLQKVQSELQNLQWIIRNPGRQWTSSLNPIIADPRDWYGEYYRSFRVGNEAVETCLRLFRRRRTYFALMDKHLFNYLLSFVLWADSFSSRRR